MAKKIKLAVFLLLLATFMALLIIPVPMNAGIHPGLWGMTDIGPTCFCPTYNYTCYCIIIK